MHAALALAIACTLPAAVAAQTDVRTGIRETYANLIPMSILPFEALDGTSPESAMQLEQLVFKDLEFSGVFKIVRGRTPAAANGDPDGLIELRGTLALHRGDAYFEGRVIDAGSGRSIGGKRYKVDPGSIRPVAHHFADEVVRMLTGESGIASTRIVFRRKSEDHWELVLSDYDGYNPQVILRQTVPAIFPRWVDGGSAIVYTSYRFGKPDLFLRDLKEAKSQTIVTFDGSNNVVDWSEARREMVASLSRDGNAEIYILDKQGQVKKRLTHSRAIETSPSWSPSGREVAFTSDRAGAPHIYVMEADGSNVRRLTTAGVYNESPAWSPKGDQIAFVSRIDGFFQLCTIRPDGTDFRLLTREAASHEDPRWAPNGRHLIYSENRGGEKLISIIDTVTKGRRLLSAGETPDWSVR